MRSAMDSKRFESRPVFLIQTLGEPRGLPLDPYAAQGWAHWTWGDETSWEEVEGMIRDELTKEPGLGWAAARYPGNFWLYYPSYEVET